MRAVKRSLKHLGDPDASQSEADQLLHTRECLLNIGNHINDILNSFDDADKITEWRRYVHCKLKTQVYFQSSYPAP